MKSTHTYSILEVSPEAYHEIRQKLVDAGYEHAIHGGSPRALAAVDRRETIDMHGIGLQAEQPEAGALESWRAFRETGLLWWVNRTLHLFGWTISLTVEEDGTVTAARPERVRFRGFERKDEEEGFRMLHDYLADNAEQLAGELESDEEDLPGLKYDERNEPICPKCGAAMLMGKTCPHCGQRVRRP